MGQTDSSQHWLREEEQEDKRVGFPELFFDLVFVFALIQLSHFIVEEFSFHRLLQGGVVALALWWVWNHTAWVMNWLNPERMPIRALLFGLMFFGLLMASAIPEAFEGKALMFAGSYIAMQLGRSLFAVYAFRNVLPDVRRNFIRVSIWFSLSAAFWLAGALAGEQMRLILWFIALLIEYAAPEARFIVPGFGRSHASDWDISGEHMAERCALFVMICLGESILAIGRSFADEDLTPLLVVIFISAFAASVTMWWIYFHFGQAKARHEIEETDEPGEVALHVFTYGHMPVVAGIILVAVSAEHILAHPGDAGDAALAAVILGGPILFLGGNLLVKRMTTGRMPRSHLAGMALAVLCLPIAAMLPNYWSGLLALSTLLLVAGWEYRGLARTPHSDEQVGELEGE
ncbi:low temperature requirement protein A [Rhizobium sp. SSA_523]|uniref:low temperature requirement protein A n=1 Tax=Rhizobium sp. SSA_523 TaxID=2952477 RepID=UPI002090C897|nr:low temperature requirement protein A [Rhizobium sp. SSA_523]MCO5730017.1 low temperature requirement protein A [Rhizobium sp. SSA_523]WKC25088.1 low temperature requirement protein A [Rhizobium sp. SSA_523]